MSILKTNRRDPCATIALVLDCFLLWGSGGCRSHGKRRDFERENFEVERETLSAGFWDPNYPVGVTVLKLFNVPAVLCMEGGYHPQIHAL